MSFSITQFCYGEGLHFMDSVHALCSVLLLRQFCLHHLSVGSHEVQDTKLTAL